MIYQRKYRAYSAWARNLWTLCKTSKETDGYRFNERPQSEAFRTQRTKISFVQSETHSQH